MKRYHRILNIIRRPAVMIDHSNLVNRLEQRLALHIAGTVDIHNDQQRVL